MQTVEFENDNQTIISDITETNSLNSFNIEDKFDEIQNNLSIELNKLNVDSLKERSKQLGISGLSKLKKPELVQLLITEFMKLHDNLKTKKINELRGISKQYKLQTSAKTSKPLIIYQILIYCSKNLIYKINTNDTFETSVKEQEQNQEPKKELTLMEQLEKQKQEIEQKMQQEVEKQRLEEEQKRIAEEQKEKEEMEKQKKAEEEQKKKDKEEAKRKKQSIPKSVRSIVWNHYIGEDIIKHKCLCCKKVTISNTNFEVGHVQSEKNGGTLEINNLRPICFACNHSMGTENMVDFVIKYGLYIG